MEELQARHRKEQRELVARITQKKKAATKRTRKGVNDECTNLERELQERQETELAALKGGSATGDGDVPKHELECVDSNSLEETAQSLPQQSHPTTNLAEDSTGPAAPKKRNRAKERLARRAAEQEALTAQAAEEAKQIPDLRKEERENMEEQFRIRGLQEKLIRPDGHCLYSAVADQLGLVKIPLKPQTSLLAVQITDDEFAGLPAYRKVRTAAAAHIKNNADDFLPFLEKDLDVYVNEVKDTAEWGGQVELMALAKTYNIPINVIQGTGSVERIEAGHGAAQDKSLWLGYYRHYFGLGEHYNSLSKVP